MIMDRKFFFLSRTCTYFESLNSTHVLYKPLHPPEHLNKQEQEGKKSLTVKKPCIFSHDVTTNNHSTQRAFAKIDLGQKQPQKT